jgi:sphingosine kinase
MDRADWDTAIKMPIAQIPGGSANALACCIAHMSNECYKGLAIEKFAAHMAFYMSKCTPKPMDLAAIQLCDGRLVHAFLNVEWAIVADVDLESEKLRYMGNLRFLVGAVKRILSKFPIIHSNEMLCCSSNSLKLFLLQNRFAYISGPSVVCACR